MKIKKFGKKIIVRIDKGEEIVDSLTRICKENNIKLGTITGIGATNKVKVGLFDPKTKEYHATQLTDDYEIAPLTGNISTMEGNTYLHLHINLCDKNHGSFGGHLNSAIVSATCECVIDAVDGEIDREFNEEIGLNLIK
jgi:predicted DNA-binding protein with PD1-like motif